MDDQTFLDHLYMPNVVHVVAYLHGFNHIYPGYLMTPMFPNKSKVRISNDFLRCLNKSFEILWLTVGGALKAFYQFGCIREPWTSQKFKLTFPFHQKPVSYPDRSSRKFEDME